MLKYFFASVGVLALSTAAAAQQAPASADVASDEAQGAIRDIIVTASRRAESAQKAALSIQAISNETLARANIVKPEDLAAVAPGVQIGTAGAYAQPYVRGVGNFGTNAASESPVPFNLDGVYISRPWAVRGMFYDLERVEVLKGPQGTLYGRNASGGAINVITAKPQLGQVSGFGEVMAGNYAAFQASGAINLPLGDRLAIRAAGQVATHDGYLSDGYDDERTASARVHLLWEPSNDVSLLLSGHYQHIGGHGPGATILPQFPGDKWVGNTDQRVIDIIRAEPGLGPILAIPKQDGFMDVDIYAVSAELNWKLGFANLTVLPAYREGSHRSLHYTAGQSVANFEKNKQTSVEVRLANQSEALKWVLGAYYFHERTTNLDNGPAQVVDLGFLQQTIQKLDTETVSYAAFGQGTFSLTDAFRLTGGLRYTYEKKSPDVLLDIAVFGMPGPIAFGPPLTFKKVTWKVGAEYDVGPQSMAYANAGLGFKSGGYFFGGAPNSFRPEKLLAFDVGLKNRFFNNTLQVNVEAFYWSYDDKQESYTEVTATGPSFVTRNAGKATLYGADLDILYRPTERDEFSLKVQYNKTKYDDFKFDWFTTVLGPPVTGCSVLPTGVAGVSTIDCSGQQLIRAPLWTGNASYRHEFNLGKAGNLAATFNAEFSSGTNLSVDYLKSGRQEAFVIGNFDLTYTTESRRISISAFVRNIWNEAVYNQAYRYSPVSPTMGNPDGLLFGTLRPPRTFGVRGRVNF